MGGRDVWVYGERGSQGGMDEGGRDELGREKRGLIVREKERQCEIGR